MAIKQQPKRKHQQKFITRVNGTPYADLVLAQPLTLTIFSRVIPVTSYRSNTRRATELQSYTGNPTKTSARKALDRYRKGRLQTKEKEGIERGH